MKKGEKRKKAGKHIFGNGANTMKIRKNKHQVFKKTENIYLLVSVSNQSYKINYTG
jgi:hypothetical protein